MEITLSKELEDERDNIQEQVLFDTVMLLGINHSELVLVYLEQIIFGQTISLK